MRTIRIIQAAVFLLAVFAIATYLNHSYTRFTEAKNVETGWRIINPPEEISAMVLRDDMLWAGGADGLFLIDIASGKCLAQNHVEAQMKYTRAILLDQYDHLWVGHDGGLSCFDGSKWTAITTENGLPDNRVNAIAEDSHGQIWAGTWGGAVKIENHTNIDENRIIGSLSVSNGLLSDMVNVILPDHQGGLWFGSYNSRIGGVSYLANDGKWQYWTIDNALPHNYVTSIFQDDNQDVWVGTGLLDRGGAVVFRFESGQWTVARTLTKDQGLAGEKVRSIFQDDRGIMWLGSEYDGVTVLDPQGWQILSKASGLSDNEVKVMVQDHRGILWMGTRYGITHSKLD